MSSLIEGYNYDIFISYRQKDNKHDGWVTGFVDQLKGELEATFKEDISIYFDENPGDGLLETYSVDKSLEGKLKCLIFIPVISQTYCDPKSYAWNHEFCTFNKLAKEDQFGRDIRLPNGNVASRILPVKIHDLDPEDKTLLEDELGGLLRCMEFIYKSAGVNRPLRANEDHPQDNLNKTYYRDQINKVANAVKEIITALKKRSQNPEEASGNYLEAKQVQQKNHSALIIAGTIIVLALLIPGIFLIPKLIKSKEKIEKSIAVLPFFNESPDSSNIYICNGLMDDILTQLHKIGDLNVKSRTSAERYRIPDKDIIRIGKELRVSYIIEGSVSKLGDNLQITVQLIDAKNGDHLWADPFNGKYTTEIFDFLNNVAKKVALSVNAVITPAEEKRIDTRSTNKIAAYDLQKRGHEMIRQWRSTRDPLTLKLANNLLDQSLKVDPEYVDALRTKSMLFSEVGSVDSALIYIEKIKDVDPGNIDIYGLKGLIYFYSGKSDSALKYFSHSEKLAPNDYWTNLALGQIYCFQKYYIIKSLPYFQKAIDLGGDSEAEVNYNIAFVFVLAGDYPKALKYFNNALSLRQECQMMVAVSSILSYQGNYGYAFDFLDSICSIIPCRQQCDMMRFKIYTCRKEIEEAEKYYVSALADGYFKNENDELYVAFLLNETGRHEEALTILHNLVDRDEGLLKTGAESRVTAYISTLRLAAAYAMMGEKKVALKYLAALEEYLLIEYPYPVKSFPGFDNLRNDPEFKTIINKIENKKALIREQIRKMEERGEINL